MATRPKTAQVLPRPRGRRVKPVKLHVLHGNPSKLPKEELERRQAAEGSEAPLGKPPPHLSDQQAEVWHWVQKELWWLSVKDSLYVESFCRTWVEYVVMQAEFQKIANVRRKNEKHLDKLLKIGKSMEKNRDLALKMLYDMGGVKSNRLRLLREIPDAEKKKTPKLAKYVS